MADQQYHGRHQRIVNIKWLLICGVKSVRRYSFSSIVSGQGALNRRCAERHVKTVDEQRNVEVLSSKLLTGLFLSHAIFASGRKDKYRTGRGSLGE